MERVRIRLGIWNFITEWGLTVLTVELKKRNVRVEKVQLDSPAEKKKTGKAIRKDNKNNFNNGSCLHLATKASRDRQGRWIRYSTRLGCWSLVTFH